MLTISFINPQMNVKNNVISKTQQNVIEKLFKSYFQINKFYISCGLWKHHIDVICHAKLQET